MNNQLDDDCLFKKEQLKRFRISAIFISYLVIEIILIPLIFLGLIFIGNLDIKEIDSYLDNKNFLLFLGIPIQAVLAGYFFSEINRAKINLWQIVGSLRKIDFKLPIALAIASYFFASGTSTMILYGISFVIPEYVENQINLVYATTPWGYVCFAIAVLLFAPVMEELFFRGIILQKLAVKKNIVAASLWSALIFALIHFRIDIISLFIFGLTLAILYLKTKQIIVPVICHFFYNLIFTIRLIHWYFFSKIDHSKTIAIAEFRQDFIDNLEWEILFITLSLPYLCYFIYKNFPRHYDLKRLPYFVNGSKLSQQNRYK